MKKLPVEQAVGETLCHDITAILENGFKGVRFSRGHVIQEEDISVLLDIGKANIFVWDPEEDEVHEEEAGEAIAKEICGENLEYVGPAEGRFQINATCNGVFVVNSKGLERINGVNDYTVACKKGYSKVKAGETLSGARIIPLVTKQENVDMAVRVAKEYAPVFSVKPYAPLKVGIIITGSEIYHGRIQDAFEVVLRKKLIEFDAQILGVTICDDELTMITTAIHKYKEDGAQLILLTGGMSVDPDDLTPTAMRKCCTKFVSQGLPVQPGNMLTIAYLNETVLVGVPGASMHSEFTSLDLFLPRIFAGIPIEKSDMISMGEGGLL